MINFQILSKVLDIEDLITTAKSVKACPYYATRKAAKDAQLILLPYNTILHSGTRAGVGLSIDRDSVLLLDEAHNLIDSISNMYSAQITLQQLQDCHNGLKLYTKKYLSRFNPQNLLHYKQLTFIVKNLVNCLGKAAQFMEFLNSLFRLLKFGIFSFLRRQIRTGTMRDGSS
jgi:chromosome transmission fidelity protein 1